MKKIIYSTLIALAGLFAASCEQEHIEVVYDPQNVEAQTLGPIAGCALSEDGSPITASYNEAAFNVPVPATYTLLVNASGAGFDSAKKVDATIADGTITIDQVKLNKLLGNLGATADAEFAADFRLDAYLVNEKGIIESTRQSSNVVTALFTIYETEKVLDVVDVPGDYQGWAPSEYPKLFNYAYDGTVYRGVVDFLCNKEDGTAANGFKITYGGNWDSDSGNWGTADQSEPAEAASVNLINGDASQNIICYGEKRYYLFSFNKDALVLTKILSFDKVGIIGLNGDWDNDIVMTYNMYKGRFWADVDVAAATEFKFRLDGGWDNNWGGAMDALQGGGANIPIDAGQYRIYFYMNDETLYCEVDASMYGQEEPAADQPDEPDEPETYQGWGMIGSFNDWAGDAAMTETDGVWTGYITLTADAEWKLRKDAGWDENFGGTFAALGEPFEAVAGGDNIKIGLDGFFKVVYDSNAGTITVFEGDVWSLIGDFNSWSGDVDMTLVDGKWVSPVTSLTPGWKIRHNHDWEDNFGGVFAEFDAPFEAVAGGDNIDCGEGKFVVTYDPEAGTITVSNAAKSWGVIGDFCGWGEDIDMTEVMPGIWVSPVLDLTGGWKIRFDNGWDINCGGATPSAQGAFVKAVPGGDNIGLEGSFKVVYNANNETIGTLGFGVTGSIASCGINWDNDIPMNLAEDGKYYSIPVVLTTADQLKVRWNAAWDINRGGKCETVDAEFDAVDGGDNISVPADGTYMVVYDPASEKLTLSTQFWGLIGDFNSWGGDTFMLPLGEGKWAAYNQTLAGGWKCRMSAGWDVNFGGVYESLGTAFPVVQDGDNISCQEENIDIVLDTVAATVTVSKL